MTLIEYPLLLFGIGTPHGYRAVSREVAHRAAIRVEPRKNTFVPCIFVQGIFQFLRL